MVLGGLLSISILQLPTIRRNMRREAVEQIHARIMEARMRLENTETGCNDVSVHANTLQLLESVLSTSISEAVGGRKERPAVMMCLSMQTHCNCLSLY